MINTENMTLEEIKEMLSQLKDVKKEKIAEKKEAKIETRKEKLEQKVDKCAKTIFKKIDSLVKLGYDRKQIAKLIRDYLLTIEFEETETET